MKRFCGDDDTEWSHAPVALQYDLPVWLLAPEIPV